MKIKSIAIELSNSAFLPEAYAYRSYLRNYGFKCDFVDKKSILMNDYDAVILYHGFHPFWRKYPKLIVGEYHSLSTGKFPRFKDLIKRLLNVRPNLYMFLNESVRKKMWFSDSVNYITRSMGYDQKDFDEFKTLSKRFDIVYCGSNRKGLSGVLKNLADLGFSIALVGPEITFEHRNITVFGRKTPKEAREIISQAKYGLNYTPNIYPFNIQDSTKVIEYCAANLGIITNRYEWVNNFEEHRKGSFLNLDSIKNKKDIESFCFVTPNVDDLEWFTLLDKTGFREKLLKLN